MSTMTVHPGEAGAEVLLLLHLLRLPPRCAATAAEMVKIDIRAKQAL